MTRTLHDHLRYHNVKRWLLRGARAEDARTVTRALRRMPSRRLVRRLARILGR